MRTFYMLTLGVIASGAAIAGIVYVMTADRTRSVLAPAFPVLVVTALVQQRDEPIVLTGLGTVEALNTATIHSQVTGLLEEVEFTEGQLVKRGDILAKIDPRVYEAALLQYQGQLAKDTALHTQAQDDLQRYQALGREDLIALQQVQDQKLLVEQDAGLMQSDQGLVDGAKTQLDFTTLRAPFDGVTGIRLLDVGNVIHPQSSSTMSTQPNADFERRGRCQSDPADQRRLHARDERHTLGSSGARAEQAASSDRLRPERRQATRRRHAASDQ